MVRRRPLFFIAFAWTLGILLGREVSPWVSSLQIWLIVLGLLILAGILYCLQYSHWPGGMLLLVISIGALFYAETRLPVERLYPLLKNLVSVRGVVTNYPDHRPERSSFVLQPPRLPGRLQIFYYHPSEQYESIDYGDELEIEARFEIPWEFEDFNYREYLLNRNIWGIGSLWSARQIQQKATHQGNVVLDWGYQTRRQIFELIDRYVSPAASGLLKGLLFGERAYLSEEVEASFRDAGVMHVLAVSGLNLGILIGLFWGILRWFRFSVSQIYVSLIPLVFAYLLLVGFEVSLVRASLMFAFVTLGWVMAERGWILKDWIDPLQGLCAAALVIWIWTPRALFDVSFQLSFAATAGIIMAVELALPLIQEQGERLRVRWHVASSLPKRVSFRLAELTVAFLLVSMAAQLAVAPILAYQFHRIYLGALLANLVVVPLATIALWLGVLVLMAAVLLVDPVTVALGIVESALLMSLMSLTQFFAQLPGAYFVIDRGTQLTSLVIMPLVLNVSTLLAVQLALSRMTPRNYFA